jgi:hypothetical protein
VWTGPGARAGSAPAMLCIRNTGALLLLGKQGELLLRPSLAPAAASLQPVHVTNAPRNRGVGRRHGPALAAQLQHTRPLLWPLHSPFEYGRRAAGPGWQLHSSLQHPCSLCQPAQALSALAALPAWPRCQRLQATLASSRRHEPAASAGEQGAAAQPQHQGRTVAALAQAQPTSKPGSGLGQAPAARYSCAADSASSHPAACRRQAGCSQATTTGCAAGWVPGGGLPQRQAQAATSPARLDRCGGPSRRCPQLAAHATSDPLQRRQLCGAGGHRVRRPQPLRRRCSLPERTLLRWRPALQPAEQLFLELPACKVDFRVADSGGLIGSCAMRMPAPITPMHLPFGPRPASSQHAALALKSRHLPCHCHATAAAPLLFVCHATMASHHLPSDRRPPRAPQGSPVRLSGLVTSASATVFIV